MASIKKRGPYQYQARIRRKGYPPVFETFPSKADAEAWAREIEGKMDRREYVVTASEAARTTLYEALKRYLKEANPKKKGAQIEAGRIRWWMGLPIAEKTLAEITGTDLAAIRDERLAAGRSLTTVKNDFQVISGVYRLARSDWGMAGLADPVKNVRLDTSVVEPERRPRERDRRLVGNEEARLLKQANAQMQAIITVALETGMRRGEIASLRRETVDRKRGVAMLADTKNGERRIVPLSTRALKALKALPARTDGRVFGLGAYAITHEFTALCRAAGIRDLRFHDLRHEATSRLFEKGLNIMEVAAITGHKTLAMLKRYTHPRAEDLKRKLG